MKGARRPITRALRRTRKAPSSRGSKAGWAKHCTGTWAHWLDEFKQGHCLARRNPAISEECRFVIEMLFPPSQLSPQQSQKQQRVERKAQRKGDLDGSGTSLFPAPWGLPDDFFRRLKHRCLKNCFCQSFRASAPQFASS